MNQLIEFRYEITNQKTINILSIRHPRDDLSVTRIDIPETIDGLPVTDINKNAFWFCFNLETLNLPNTLLRIGENAFANTKITSIKIPQSVEVIGDGAFYDCENLRNIHMPNHAVHLGAFVFDNTDYYYNPENWTNNLLYIDRHLVQAKGEIKGTPVVNADTLSIAAATFENQQMSSIILPNNLEFIEPETFCGCKSLKHISLPPTIKIIGENAFSYSGLESINIPNSVLTVEDKAFSLCENLSKVKIGNSVKCIGEEAFYGCRNLGLIKILNDSIDEIAYSAFDFSGEKLIIQCEKNSKTWKAVKDIDLLPTAINAKLQAFLNINNLREAERF